MKLNLSLIQDIINIKINSIKIVKQLIQLGYEIEKSYNLFKYCYIKKKIILTKIINVQQISKKKFLYCLYFGKGIKIHLISTFYDKKFCYKNQKVIILIANKFVVFDKSENLLIKLNLESNKNKFKFLFYNSFSLNESQHYMFSIIQHRIENIPLGKILNKYVNLTDKLINLKPSFNRKDLTNVFNVCREIDALNNKTGIYIPKYKINDSFIKSNISIINHINPNYFFYTGVEIQNIKICNQIPIYIYNKLLCIDKTIEDPLINILKYVFIETGVVVNIFNSYDIDKNIVITSRHFNDEFDEKIFTYSYVNKKILSIAGKSFNNNQKGLIRSKNIYIESISLTQDFLNQNSYFNKYIGDLPNNIFQSLIIDNNLQIYAVNYVAKLIQICFGGNIGHLNIIGKNKNIYLNKNIKFNINKVNSLIGQQININKIKKILINLNFIIKIINKFNFEITPPNWRIDVISLQDIVEEILKIYGYNKLKTKKNHLIVHKSNFINKYNTLIKIKYLLINKGYQEIITYSLIDLKLQKVLLNKTIKIINPISKELTFIRTSLLNGLLNNIIYNQNYQINRLKLFEIGNCYIKNNTFNKNKLHLPKYNFLSGAMFGNKNKRKWCFESKLIDIFDVKGDIEDICELLYINNHQIKIQNVNTSDHIFLNKNYGNIYINNIFIGQIGYISHKILNQLKINTPILFFEINLDFILNLNNQNKYNINICYLPIYERDISLILNEDIPIYNIIEECKQIMRKYLLNIDIFDVYTNQKMKLNNQKSIGLNFILQDKKTTLSNKKINDILENCINKLKLKFNLILRKS